MLGIGKAKTNRDMILSTVRFNDEFKNYYDKMKERNYHSTVIQLALLAHSLYKNKCQYDPKQYLNKKLENNIEKVA